MELNPLSCFEGTLLEKPREKANRLGLNSLSDVELLALVIETGDKRENVLELSSRLLIEKGGLRGIFLKNEKGLYTYGVKKAKAFRLLAIGELIKRLPLAKDETILSASDAFEKTRFFFLGKTKELGLVIFLSEKRKVLCLEEMTFGTSSQVFLPIDQVVKKAVNVEASFLILIHNHPSGNLNPSNADLSMTGEINARLGSLKVLFLDSLIVSEDGYCSLRKLHPDLFS
ncbi:MAG: JAB domain-containing protein [Bacilli bacterium]|jgi:DNA repair protein RadC